MSWRLPSKLSAGNTQVSTATSKWKRIPQGSEWVFEPREQACLSGALAKVNAHSLNQKILLWHFLGAGHCARKWRSKVRCSPSEIYMSKNSWIRNQDISITAHWTLLSPQPISGYKVFFHQPWWGFYFPCFVWWERGGSQWVHSWGHLHKDAQRSLIPYV